jgi:DNA-binding NarL/FixJ family response regulator
MELREQILIVMEDKHMSSAISSQLKDAGFCVRVEDTCRSAKMAHKQMSFDLVVMDTIFDQNHESGLNLLSELHQYPSHKVVITRVDPYVQKHAFLHGALICISYDKLHFLADIVGNILSYDSWIVDSLNERSTTFLKSEAKLVYKLLNDSQLRMLTLLQRDRSLSNVSLAMTLHASVSTIKNWKSKIPKILDVSTLDQAIHMVSRLDLKCMKYQHKTEQIF